MKRLVALAVLAAVIVLGVWAANRTEPSLPAGKKADLVVVEKEARRLSAFAGGTLLRSYRVALGRSPVGAKVREGDNKTPEGRYVIDFRNPKSAYHLSLHVSYPAPEDIARARAVGLSPGGDIMIHGLPNSLGWLGAIHRLSDWTQGCVAVTNSEIEELWRIVPDGTPVQIKP